MSPSYLNRREFVQSGLTLAGGAALGLSLEGCDFQRALAPEDAVGRADRVLPDLPEPRVLSSVGGILTASIVASTVPVTIAGRRVLQPVTYNGTFPGPTLWVHPGDYLDLTFANKIVFDQASATPGYGRPPRVAKPQQPSLPRIARAPYRHGG
jgi:FtsP/CotA-like multicopper oxidase with cupredoxin domain